MTKTVTIDVTEFNRMFENELPDANQKVATKLAEHHQQAGMAALNINLDDLASVKDNYCDAWPKISSTLLLALGVLAWVPGVGNYAGLVRAWLRTYEAKLHPMLCQSAAGTGPVIKKNF